MWQQMEEVMVCGDGSERGTGEAGDPDGDGRLRVGATKLAWW